MAVRGGVSAGFLQLFAGKDVHNYLRAGFFTFGQTETEERADILLILSPLEDLAGEKIDERDRDHIADNSGGHSADQYPCSSICWDS